MDGMKINTKVLTAAGFTVAALAFTGVAVVTLPGERTLLMTVVCGSSLAASLVCCLAALVLAMYLLLSTAASNQGPSKSPRPPSLL